MSGPGKNIFVDQVITRLDNYPEVSISRRADGSYLTIGQIYGKIKVIQDDGLITYDKITIDTNTVLGPENWTGNSQYNIVANKSGISVLKGNFSGLKETIKKDYLHIGQYQFLNGILIKTGVSGSIHLPFSAQGLIAKLVDENGVFFNLNSTDFRVSLGGLMPMGITLTGGQIYSPGANANNDKLNPDHVTVSDRLFDPNGLIWKNVGEFIADKADKTFSKKRRLLNLAPLYNDGTDPVDAGVPNGIVPDGKFGLNYIDISRHSHLTLYIQYSDRYYDSVEEAYSNIYNDYPSTQRERRRIACVIIPGGCTDLVADGAKLVTWDNQGNRRNHFIRKPAAGGGESKTVQQDWENADHDDYATPGSISFSDLDDFYVRLVDQITLWSPYRTYGKEELTIAGDLNIYRAKGFSQDKDPIIAINDWEKAAAPDEVKIPRIVNHFIPLNLVGGEKITVAPPNHMFWTDLEICVSGFAGNYGYSITNITQSAIQSGIDVFQAGGAIHTGNSGVPELINALVTISNVHLRRDSMIFDIELVEIGFVNLKTNIYHARNGAQGRTVDGDVYTLKSVTIKGVIP